MLACCESNDIALYLLAVNGNALDTLLCSVRIVHVDVELSTTEDALDAVVLHGRWDARVNLYTVECRLDTKYELSYRIPVPCSCTREP